MEKDELKDNALTAAEQVRELTVKYVYGLSYINYNVLVTNWDNNIEDILMLCMLVCR